jgi:hypothetical protein
MSTTTILQLTHVFGLDDVNGQPLGTGYTADTDAEINQDPVVFRLTEAQRDRVQAAFDADVEIDLDVSTDAFLFGRSSS